MGDRSFTSSNKEQYFKPTEMSDRFSFKVIKKPQVWQLVESL
jgi:hypothetical protein